MEISQLNRNVHSAHLDVKVLELRLKERDQALRGSIIRHKELTSIMDHHRKLQKEERLRLKNVQMVVH